MAVSSHVPLKAQEASEAESSVRQQYRQLITKNRAKNLARQAAEQENGGLGQYRAEPAMHGPVEETNYEEIEDGVWRFTIRGREIGSDDFTIQTVVTVDEQANVTVESNEEI
ncbi:hypothetical protein FRE64_00705 [Euhalothece natronophila Z-M001]|uniref:Uncharacterized protein n=2 Tax=Euhalothece TaxID=65097 RepID=A0A5B8NQT8_9CHRO|nr:hypothetical protein FRE64_00705 [Euhalothece natronophila Z-M001]